MAWVQETVDGGEAGLIPTGRWRNTETGEVSATPPALPAGLSTYTKEVDGGEAGTIAQQAYSINGTPYDQFQTTYSGTGANGRQAGVTTNPATGQQEKSFFVQTPSGPIILPESVAKAMDPNAIPYEQTADGGYGGLGGFLDQWITPALMAGVGAAGAMGLGQAGFGSAGVPDALSSFGGGSFGGNGMDFLSEIAGGYGNSPAGIFGDGGYDFLSEIAGGYGNAPSGTFNGIESLIKQYGPSVAKSVVTAAGGDGGIVDKLLSNPAMLGAGLGALAGGLGGSKQAGTQTTVTDIPDWLKPYAMNSLNRASSMFDGLDTSNPLLPAAQSQMMKTIQGDYLSPDSNPYLKGTFDRAAGEIQSKLSPSFGHMQAFGNNTGWQQAYGRSLADLSTSLYGGNYQQERGRQLGAAGQAPSFTTGSYESRFAPFSQYQNLMKFGGSQTSSPYYENKLGNILGGAMTGYGLGRVFK